MGKIGHLSGHNFKNWQVPSIIRNNNFKKIKKTVSFTIGSPF